MNIRVMNEIVMGEGQVELVRKFEKHNTIRPGIRVVDLDAKEFWLTEQSDSISVKVKSVRYTALKNIHVDEQKRNGPPVFSSLLEDLQHYYGKSITKDSVVTVIEFGPED